jgi:hypothetical protein
MGHLFGMRIHGRFKGLSGEIFVQRTYAQELLSGFSSKTRLTDQAQRFTFGNSPKSCGKLKRKTQKVLAGLVMEADTIWGAD